MAYHATVVVVLAVATGLPFSNEKKKEEDSTETDSHHVSAYSDHVLARARSIGRTRAPLLHTYTHI